MTGRCIGIDYGSKRIGIAVSDALGIGARELTILPANDGSYAKIIAIAEREGAVGLVVGVPENPNAPPGVALQADRVREWIAGLRALTALPVEEVGEYLSSHAAREIAAEQGRRPHEAIDDLAARVILQAWLDARYRTRNALA